MTISVSAVFDRATVFVGDHARSTAGLALLPFVASLAQQVGAPAFADAAPAAQAGWGIASVLLSLVSLCGQLAIAAYVVRPEAGPGRAIGVAVRRLPVAVLLYLVLLLALALTAAPIVGALAANGWQAGSETMPEHIGTGALAFVSLWGGLILVVSLVTAARLVPLLAVIVAERRGVRSFARAVRLTRGLTAKLTGLLLLATVVATVATVAVQTVVGSLSRLLLDGEGPVTPASIVTGLAVALVVAGLTTLVAAFAGTLYRLLVAPDGATAAA